METYLEEDEVEVEEVKIVWIVVSALYCDIHKSGDGKVFFIDWALLGKSKLQAGGAQKLQYSGLPSHIFICIFIMI